MIELTHKQHLAYSYLNDQTTKELVFGGGAGGGKSFFACVWIIENCFKYPGTRWVIGRSSLKTLRETTLVSFFQVMEKQKIPVEAYQFNENKGEVKFYNGSVVLLKDLFQYPADPNFDSLGSLEITGAAVDEISEISQKAWDILRSRIRYKLDENGIVPKILGTCNPSKGWVYENFYKPHRDSTLTESRKFVQSLLSDNKNISKHYEETLKTLDIDSVERLLHGNWEYDSDARALCSYPSILDCFDSHHLVRDTSLPMFMSVDIAGAGRDLFVIAVWQGDFVEIELVRKKSDGPKIVDDIISIAQKYSIPASKVIVDSDGLGSLVGGFIGNIVKFHGGSPAKAKKEFSNIKTECGYKLAEKINKGKLKIICDNYPQYKQRIIKELEVLKAKAIDEDERKKSLLSKNDMKKAILHSPDFLDSLIMGCYFDLAKQLTWLIV